VFAGLEHLVLAAGPRLKPGESPNEALDALLDELRGDAEPELPRAQTPSAATPRIESAGRSTEQGRTSPEMLANSKPAANDRPAASDETGEADAVDEIDVTPAVPREPSDASTAIDAVAARRARRLRLAASNEAEPHATPAAVESPVDEPAVEVARAAPAVELEIRPEDLMQRPQRRRRWWMPIALLLGLALLTGQVLYLQFDAWAKNPEIRPVYEWLCPRLHCELPVMRSLDEIRSKNLVVRANPDVPGELMVDAIIVNQARFAQPFPVIELRFSSMEGRPIAARRFKPEEYLAGELKGATMFAPLTPVHIALAIEDPGTDAVSYYIQFR
jgi:hypothetical protein